jgi:hypothetical protein
MPLTLKDILNGPHEYKNGTYVPLPPKPVEEVKPAEPVKPSTPKK